MHDASLLVPRWEVPFVARHDVIRVCCLRTLEKAIVVRVSRHRHFSLRRDERGSAVNETSGFVYQVGVDLELPPAKNLSVFFENRFTDEEAVLECPIQDRSFKAAWFEVGRDNNIGVKQDSWHSCVFLFC